MSDELVLFEQLAEEVAVCILNRPEKRNALSIKAMQELCMHIERVEKDGKIRILILRGNGPCFCAGLDIEEVADPKLGVESAKMVKRCLSALYQISIVTIAMVHGAAIGGGAGLVAACDLAVAVREATIGFPEVRRGLIPAQVMSLLVRKLKRADVHELLLSGESISAERALQMGLFTRLGNLENETQAIVSQVLQCAPGAIAKTKQLIDALNSRQFQEDIETGLMKYIQVWEEREAQEGVRAFLEKRKPSWHKS
jgi:methylglutaconyl-CoA hydratase